MKDRREQLTPIGDRVLDRGEVVLFDDLRPGPRKAWVSLDTGGPSVIISRQRFSWCSERVLRKHLFEAPPKWRNGKPKSNVIRREELISQRARRYGLDSDAVVDMYETQNGECPICMVAWSLDDLAIDHDHGSSRVHGLLCRSCNTSSGMADRYGPAWLINMFKYRIGRTVSNHMAFKRGYLGSKKMWKRLPIVPDLLMFHLHRDGYDPDCMCPECHDERAKLGEDTCSNCGSTHLWGDVTGYGPAGCSTCGALLRGGLAHRFHVMETTPL